jgi:hypothetical protein
MNIDYFSRRDFLRLSSLGVLAPSLSGWLAPLAARAAESRAKTRSCILLWMDGGPSQKDTFDMKPGTKDGGEFKPIATSVPGIQISEHLPNLAKQMQHAAILRGMTTGEGAHGRAKVYMHTGYKEGIGGLVYPSLGAIASKELGKPEFPLPNFVTIGNRSYGAGFLGPKHQPLNVTDASRGVESLKSALTEGQFSNRFGLLEEMEAGFFKQYGANAATDHRTTYERAVRLMQSKEARAFDLDREAESAKSRYGSGKFAEGCLLARRLIETGVTFVEVTLGGWDTHQNNFKRVKDLSSQIDQPISSLIEDLKQRGLLDSTLIVWMGEFGRTPKINTKGAQPGRDHYPKAWTSVLFGGGIKGGQVISKTDSEGAAVTDRPISALDFMATICKVLGIDYNKQNESNIGRPIRIVDKGAKPLTELF